MPDVFLTERDADTLIVTPTVNLGETEFDESMTQKVMELLKDETIKNLLLDFHRTEYFGSTALGFFVRLWKRTRQRHGRMAFCNVSEHECEILRITRLDELWAICPTRAEALDAVRQSAPA